MSYYFTNGRLLIRDSRPDHVSRDGQLATQGVSGSSGHAIWYKNNKGRGRIVAAGMGVVDSAEYAAGLYGSMVRWHVIHDPEWKAE